MRTRAEIMTISTSHSRAKLPTVAKSESDTAVVILIFAVDDDDDDDDDSGDCRHSHMQAKMLLAETTSPVSCSLKTVIVYSRPL